MKVWPIDPLVPRNLRLEVPEKLPQGLTKSQAVVRRLVCGCRRHTWMRGTPARPQVPPRQVIPGRHGHNLGDRDNPQPSRLPHRRADRFNARKGVGSRELKVRATPTREGAASYPPAVAMGLATCVCRSGSTELACGSQAFIATLLFDPSMSALPIIPKQNSVSVGLFTH